MVNKRNPKGSGNIPDFMKELESDRTLAEDCQISLSLACGVECPQEIAEELAQKLTPGNVFELLALYKEKVDKMYSTGKFGNQKQYKKGYDPAMRRKQYINKLKRQGKEYEPKRYGLNPNARGIPKEVKLLEGDEVIFTGKSLMQVKRYLLKTKGIKVSKPTLTRAARTGEPFLGKKFTLICNKFNSKKK